MIGKMSITPYLRRKPAAAIFIYAAVVATFLYAVLSSLLTIWEQNSALSASEETLARLEQRYPSGLDAKSLTDSMPAGSPLIEGHSVTTASAALMRRLATSIVSAGGTVASS